MSGPHKSSTFKLGQEFLNQQRKTDPDVWKEGKVIGSCLPKHFKEEREYYGNWLQTNSPLNHPLLEVQKKSVAAAAALKFSLIWDDMGLGKTAQALAVDKLCHHENTVIFCPNNVKKVWMAEIVKFTGENTKNVYVGSGSDLPVLPSVFVRKFRYLIFNYEALMVAGKTPKAPIPAVFKVCTHHILDEAHNFRNPRTQRFRAYLKYLGEGLVKSLTVLTGTPIDRCINEVWPYLAMLDMNPLVERKEFFNYFSNFSKFSDRYAIPVPRPTKYGTSVTTHKGYRKNVFHEIENIIGPRAIQRKIQDVVELPKVNFREVFLQNHLFKEDMSKVSQQFSAAFGMIHSNKRMYKDFMSGGDGDSTIAAVQSLRVNLAKQKIRWAYDMAVKYLEFAGKVIIFSEFIEPLRMFEKLAKEYTVSYAIGKDMTLAERDSSVKAFKDGGVDFLLATFGALSEGENLQQCQCMIMNDLPWQPLVVTQASRRIWRIGQKKECHIVQMECAADKVLKRIITSKQDMIHEFETQLENIKQKYDYF